MFTFMEKLNLGFYQVAWISFFKGLLIGILLMLLSSCGIQYQVSTLSSDGIYESDDMYPIYLEVPQDTKIDTINNIFQLKRKLRTDFNFRWDFAQYAMTQPLSWYYNNPRLDGIWRPYNRFDVYFNSHLFWTNWAWDYPYHYGWNYYGWSRPWYYGWYNRPYNMWWNYNHYNHPYHHNNIQYSYNVGRRGSINRIISGNSNIENTISSRRYNNPNRKDIINSNLNNIVNELRENYNVKPRVYDNPNNVPNNNVNYNRGRNNNNNVIINNNSNNNFVRPSRPSYNSRPPVNNSSNISRGSSSSVRSSGGSSSGGSSRGSRGNN